MRLAFVDLETTGGSPVDDRITEVGIIEVDLDDLDDGLPKPVREWSTLVNPDAPIPPFIETLTGISNAMVADAPRFEDLAHDILARLDDRLFIAHNARFDHGFLKNAFRRLGHPFRPPVLCTVRLSRKLYPGYSRHNLDTLIERHRLVVDMRHRALGDARLLWQLWQKIHSALPADQITAAIDQLTARPSLPRHLDPDVLDTLPKTAGVYLFHGVPTDDEKAECAAAGRIAEPRPLYVGKAKNLRQRVMAHFTGDHLSAREMEISQQMTGLEWIETGGGTQHDLGALLVEATLVKARMPAYNRQLRKSDDVCAWRLVIDRARGRWKLALARPDDLFFAQDHDLYGPFATPRQAGVALRAIADAHGLCPALLKLDRVASGKPCFSHQVKRCHGACVGLETVAEHTGRLHRALASTALVPWPFAGAVAFREGATYHVVDGWAYLGMANDLIEARRLAVTRRLFDADVYRLLVRRIDVMAVVRLDGDDRPLDTGEGPSSAQWPVRGRVGEPARTVRSRARTDDLHDGAAERNDTTLRIANTDLRRAPDSPQSGADDPDADHRHPDRHGRNTGSNDGHPNDAPNDAHPGDACAGDAHVDAERSGDLHQNHPQRRPHDDASHPVPDPSATPVEGRSDAESPRPAADVEGGHRAIPSTRPVLGGVHGLGAAHRDASDPGQRSHSSEPDHDWTPDGPDRGDGVGPAPTNTECRSHDAAVLAAD